MPDLEPVKQPDRHCLLIDHGNSAIKWIGAVWSASTDAWNLDLTTFGEGSVGDLEARFQSGEMMPPEEVCLCSVGSDSVKRDVRAIIARHSSAQVVEMSSAANTRGVSNGYPDFAKLGSDRWMAIVGGTSYHGFPLVIMDLGTATTLDAVDHEGRHLGGLIVPGPGTMLASLGKVTALEAEENSSRRTLSRRSGEAQTDTGAAVNGGMVSAQIGALGQFLKWFRNHLGSNLTNDPVVVVTGGAANAILGKTDYPVTHDPLLVFKGMLICRFDRIDDVA